MKKTAIAVIVICAASSVLSQHIDKTQIKPSASIVLDLPKLGKSWRSKGKSDIQAKIILPKNYSSKARHPVIVHLGGGLWRSWGS